MAPSHDGGVISKLDESVGAVCGHAIMGEQGWVYRGPKHTSLGSPGSSCTGGIDAQVFVMSLDGALVSKAKL